MKIFLNQKEFEVKENSIILEVVKDFEVPFAVTLNDNFVPKSDYSQVLQENDFLEVISPITGG